MKQSTPATNAELLVILQKSIDELQPKSDAGDDKAHIEWAFCRALYKYLEDGHKLTDLDWFAGTTYYTGDSKHLKSA